MDMESRTKRCAYCNIQLIINSIHMGIPFGLREGRILCGACYDIKTVDDHKVQRVGDEVI